MRFIDSDFDGWWRDVGQFIPPCDKLDDADRKLFKQFAKGIKSTLDEKSEELTELEIEHQKLTDKLEAIDDTSIKEILGEIEISSFDKINKLKKLYEDKS